MLIDGVVFRHTSVRGDTAPDLHPVVRRFLHELPAAQRERFAGWCAETVLISDRLHLAERDRPGPLTGSAARAELWGATLSVVWVREPGDPVHGTPCPSCRSCAALLDWFGVEAIGTPVAAVRDLAAAGGTAAGLAQRWRLALGSYAAPDGRRHDVVPAAVAAFSRYGGSRVEASGPGDQVAPTGYVIDPTRALHTVGTMAALGTAIGRKVTPLGVTDDGAGLLAIDEDGRVFVIDATAEWWLGDGIDGALDALLTGRAPARLREDGTWT
ncbi:hypothetical protein GCM10009681_10330 [Luedemannella helvata]|uniref:Uncharacterized protein n=1 Tax=Luedemannella helvata TaxID=349315 RepID=A0ABP4W0J3_9ACTN